MATSRSTRIRVNVDPELALAAKRAARAADCTISALIYGIVDARLRPQAAVPDRNTVILEYLSIQVDLVLMNANPALKKKARETLLKKFAGLGNVPAEVADAV